MIKMKNKKAFEIGFNLIFGIVVGAVIIFFAIYATTKLIKTGEEIQSTELGKELGIILNPIETAFETGKSDKIKFPEETRLFNDCKLSGTFGAQEISTASKSLNGEWQKPSFPSSFRNKYLFSSSVLEGKTYFIFSKPFEMPFKVASLIYIWDQNQAYCFIDAPREIESDVEDLNLNNIFTENCTKESKKVCFSTSGCDIDVSLDLGRIKGSLKRKNQERVYFEDSALLYAAIFSSPEIYECQLRRLMKRTSELSSLYYSKTIFLSQKRCNSNLEADLSVFSNKTFSFNNSLQLRDINLYAEEIRRKNDGLSCKLF